MARKKTYGFSFSLSRLIGLQTLKQIIARMTGVPTTRIGRQRKVGDSVLTWFFGKKH